MAPWFTVLMPTRDSAAWMGVLLEHYAARGVVPTLLLDSRTSDATREIAARAAAPVVDVRGFTHTEAVVRVAKDCVATPWALFIHDDEVPSDKLFARLAGPPPPESVQSVVIPRRWVWYEPGKPLLFGRSGHWHDRTQQPGTDHTWRLFRPTEVEYVSTMHTEGFYLDRWSRFPLDTYNIHFEWVLRSERQREAKLRRYDDHRWGYGRFFNNMYLPERQLPGIIEYAPVATDAYDRLAAAYFAARGPDLPLPRRRLKTQFARAKKYLIDRIIPPDMNKETPDRKGLKPKLEREVVDPFNEAVVDDFDLHTRL